MKAIQELVFGFSDAENYRRRENKELFNRIFLRTDAIVQLQKPHTYFLVGEKGTGKTAYAVNLSNTPTPKMESAHKYIRETDYSKFLKLKQDNEIAISEYVDVWKVIILLLCAKQVDQKARFIERVAPFSRFKILSEAIDAYYAGAFAPEISTAFQFVENAALAAELLAEAADKATGSKLKTKLGAKRETSLRQDGQKFQTNLLFLQKQFEEALGAIKLKKNLTVFIDGIDIRPSSVPYAEYLECVKGLANAVWSLNNDYFANIKDTDGRIKIVLLLRPDIFNSLGLQNRNTKLKDNAVLLNWVTNYDVHRRSEIFLMADRLFSAQQEISPPPGVSWDYYFPFNATNVGRSEGGPSSFITFLRYSYHRPRDILTMLDFLKLQHEKKPNRAHFEFGDLFSSEFKTNYGNYLLGELRDSLMFYYDEREYEIFLKFFEYLRGGIKFDYATYIGAYAEFNQFLISQQADIPKVMETAEEFLQFLYEQNVLCFKEQGEDEPFIRWCFRERTLADISPKVKIGQEYEIHYGLANTLNIGKKFVAPKGPANKVSTKLSPGRSVGKIKHLPPGRAYGFIVQEGLPIDIYFKLSDCDDSKNLSSGVVVSYKLENSGGRLIAKHVASFGEGRGEKRVSSSAQKPNGRGGRKAKNSKP